MDNIRFLLIGMLGFLCVAPTTAFADPKIEEELLAPSGKSLGFALSPHGMHVASLVPKGSRFVVMIDGVEGPKIDQLLSIDGSPYMAATYTQTGMSLGAKSIPVIFSDDGARWAYLAKMGDEYLIMVDGKELCRANYTAGALGNGPLSFSPGGKHLYYCESTNGYRIVMDGKPQPVSHTPPKVVTSRDGAHYAYIGTQADGMDTPWGVVDGKQVKYFGDDLQFTAKGHLFAMLKGKGEMALNIDGHNVLVANGISQLAISSGGGEFAAVVYNAKAGKSVLVVNGKPVAGTEGVQIQKVFFSPDDKHYAALCGTSNPYMIIDGKKGQQYQGIAIGNPSTCNQIALAHSWVSGLPINDQILREMAASAFPTFTADSTKFVYTASTAGKLFLVTDDDESDGYADLSPLLSPDGNHVAWIASRGYEKPAVCLDGKLIPFKGRANTGPVQGGVNSLAFTPDGAHLIATTNGGFYVDGVELPDLVCLGQYLYSPDSQHVLMVASSASNPNRGGIFLDGKLVTSGPGINNSIRPAFSPDSKHVFWIGHRSPETTDDYECAVLYVDGKPTPLRFITEVEASMAGNWQISPEGVLTFVARTAVDLKRFHVTPAPERTLSTMLAEATAAKVK